MPEYMTTNSELHATFVDLEKAFDSVSKKLIWWALRAKEAPKKYDTVQ